MTIPAKPEKTTVVIPRDVGHLRELLSRLNADALWYAWDDGSIYIRMHDGRDEIEIRPQGRYR